MKKYEKVKAVIVDYLQKQLKLVEKSKNASSILTICTDIGLDIEDIAKKECKKFKKDQYFETDRELNKFFNEEI